MIRNSKLLDKNRSGLIVIDMQKKLLKVMNNNDDLIANTVKLISGFKIFKIPILLTEQNPEALGETATPLKKILGKKNVKQKDTFSCCGIDGFIHHIRSMKLDQLVICGIECHICVLQTAMDLLSEDFQVSVVMDCTSSRKESDYRNSLERMSKEGISVTTYESVLFEFLKDSQCDEFKKIADLIK